MKDHHAGNLYWPHTLAAVPSYPALEGHAKVQAAIIGGGMSGALCGLLFARSGISCCVLERDSVAGASSAANTGLLQFSNDIILNTYPQTDRKGMQIGRAFQSEIDHFVDCAASGKEPISPVEDGVEIMKILSAIYESAAQGREVTFP